MLIKAAYTFAVVYIVIGVLGFVPAAAPDGMLLGVFHVDAMHNVVHLASGVVAAITAMMGARWARVYFQVFGVVYALVAVVGFVQGDSILGVFGVNAADNWLHVLLAAVSLYFGFVEKSD